MRVKELYKTKVIKPVERDGFLVYSARGYTAEVLIPVGFYNYLITQGCTVEGEKVQSYDPHVRIVPSPSCPLEYLLHFDSYNMAYHDALNAPVEDMPLLAAKHATDEVEHHIAAWRLSDGWYRHDKVS